MDKLFNYVRENKSRLMPLAILLFLGLATILVLQLSRRSQELRTKAVSYTGTLSFNPTSVSLQPGATMTTPISVILNTGNQSAVGADILVQFDQTKLELTNITKETHANFKTYAPVDANGNFDTAKVVSTANSTGVVEFGIVTFDWAASNVTNAFTGIFSPVSRLTFRAKPGVSGTTTISFKYTAQGNTTDSNIVHNPAAGDPEDILQQPTSQVTVSFGGASTTASPSPSPSTVPSPSLGTCNTCYNFDASADGKIGILDVLNVANRFGSTTGQPNYGTLYDIYCVNNQPDGVINILDVLQIGNRFGQTSCTP